jgi:hypothetical protein
MRAYRVRALLMGGQACVFYGAAEFSRDTTWQLSLTPPTSSGFVVHWMNYRPKSSLFLLSS